MGWDTSRGLSPAQMFPSTIIYLISNRFKEPSLCEIGNGFPVLKWSRSLHGWFYMMDLETTLTVTVGKLG